MKFLTALLISAFLLTACGQTGDLKKPTSEKSGAYSY